MKRKQKREIALAFEFQVAGILVKMKEHIWLTISNLCHYYIMDSHVLRIATNLFLLSFVMIVCSARACKPKTIYFLLSITLFTGRLADFCGKKKKRHDGKR